MKILTFDIEDWFHILDNPETARPQNWGGFESRVEAGVDTILNLLNRTNHIATFFCLGWVAEKYPNVIKRIADTGHEIATHSYGHQLAYTQSRSEFREDLSRSIGVLEAITGDRINTYRAPGFSVVDTNLWVFEVLGELGIEVDCSIFPARRSHGGLPRYSTALPSNLKYSNFTFKSFPINTANVFGKDVVYSGGGYFRLLPSFYLNKRFANDKYIMTYFHPRDFDVNQPIAPGLNAARRFKSYVGLGTAYAKLERLLRKHEFVNVESAVDIINWSSVDTIDLSPMEQT